jgi:hypothetical protein
MDEYQLEIQNLRRQLAHLREADADPALIEEYEAEVRNLTALYRAAVDTFTAAERVPELARALAMLGFGEWSLVNVYSFVYDLAMELPLDDAPDLATIVNQTDFAGSLLESLDR